ncbi:MAG: histidine phosphatase family protein [Candidatus Aenigmarchaeota archaeon]|nr:histidine phosphatase family protein [Candidatus Aenigmarchaeota archaeon]
MKLLVMRHADTDWNKMGYLSYTDISLSAQGRHRAEEAAKKLSGEGINAIAASPLMRARETAEIIASFIRVPVREDDRLREVNFGMFEGLSKTEASEKFPEEFALREKDKWNHAPENGESYREAGMRVEYFMKALDSRKKTLVITHATLIKIFLMMYGNADLNSVEGEPINPCSCFELEAGKCRKLL